MPTTGSSSPSSEQQPACALPVPGRRDQTARRGATSLRLIEFRASRGYVYLDPSGRAPQDRPQHKALSTRCVAGSRTRTRPHRIDHRGR